MEKSQQTLIKIIMLFAALIFVALLSVGIIQTFVHNGLLAKSTELQTQNEQVLQDTSEVEEEIEIRESNEFNDDYLEQEEGYGNDGDIIIAPAP